MKQKFLIFCLSFFLFINNFVQIASAVESSDILNSPTEYKKIVLIINQVRGSECCDPGSKENLLQQINTLKKNNLDGNFAVRYDALTDSTYANLLKNMSLEQFQIGAFLEITPNLARDAGVNYSGEITDWYKAQNAYTVGYSFEDRKKIVDTYMEKFKSVFGDYPKFSTAWLMDTDTVNYLKTYGITTHQITREQWGTDSYTLSGGPVHYPYFASENWLFSKAEEQVYVNSEGKSHILVLRQTGADPLFNYGDNTNSFTTQPNDYSIGQRGFDYFDKLKTNLLDQKHNNYGFLLLGLENSMAGEHQVEFEKQLKSISDDSETQTLTIGKFEKYFATGVQEVVGLEGRDLVMMSGAKSFWINGLNYRVRLLYKNNSLYISDLRVAGDHLEDPYNNYLAQDLAFWVAPYIFNASQHYNPAEPVKLSYFKNFKDKVLDELRQKYLPEFQKTNFEAKPSSNDLLSYFDGIKVSENIENVEGFSRTDSGDLVLTWMNESGKENTITFFEGTFETNFIINSRDLIMEVGNYLSVDETRNGFEVKFDDDENGGKFLSMLVNCESKSCKFSFDQATNEGFTKLRKNFYPYFFPEIKQRLLDNLNSVFYAHNKYAVVGKSPVRLVFIPRDNRGFATDYTETPEIKVDPLIKAIAFHDRQSNGTTFIDLFDDKVGGHQVHFSIGDEIDKNLDVFFAPNCKIDKNYCIFHPIQATWYLKSMFYTKLRNF